MARIMPLARPSIRPAFAAVVAAGLLTAACSSSGGDSAPGGNTAPSGSGSDTSACPSDLPVLTVGSGAQGNTMPLFEGVEAGVFKKYCVNVKVQVLDPTAAAAGLVSGSIDVAADGNNLVAAIVTKPSAKVIFGTGDTAYKLVPSKGITDWSQLKGKTIATTTPGGGADSAVRGALRDHGLDPDSDVKITYLKQNSAALAALKAGRVDGAVLSPPTSISAEESGLSFGFDISSYTPPVVWAVNSSYGEAHKDTVIAFLRGFAASIRDSQQNLDGFSAATKKYADETDTDVIKGTQQAYSPLWELQPFAADDVKEIFDGLTPPATQDPNSVIDNSYMDAFGQANWIKAGS